MILLQEYVEKLLEIAANRLQLSVNAASSTTDYADSQKQSIIMEKLLARTVALL